MYDSEATVITDSLHNANPTVFTQATINEILALAAKDGNAKVMVDTVTPDANGNVTVPAGTEITYVNSSDTAPTTMKAPANAPVVIFQGKGGVIATINDASATVAGAAGVVDRVVIGSSGNDNIQVQDARNTKVILGTGDSTVTAGLGHDTVEAGLGNSTIVGAGKADVVKMAGTQSNYTVTVNNGHAVVTNNSTAKTTDISKLQYVQLDNNSAFVFAKNSVEAQVSTLYHSLFGRTADSGGLNYWFEIAKAGATLKQIASAFVQSAEAGAIADLSNTAYIQSLYQNTFGRAGEDSGVAYWSDILTKGGSRAEVLTSFAEIAIQNQLGTAQNAEATVVGSNTIKIITGII